MHGSHLSLWHKEPANSKKCPYKGGFCPKAPNAPLWLCDFTMVIPIIVIICIFYDTVTDHCGDSNPYLPTFSSMSIYPAVLLSELVNICQYDSKVGHVWYIYYILGWHSGFSGWISFWFKTLNSFDIIKHIIICIIW